MAKLGDTYLENGLSPNRPLNQMFGDRCTERARLSQSYTYIVFSQSYTYIVPVHIHIHAWEWTQRSST